MVAKVLHWVPAWSADPMMEAARRLARAFKVKGKARIRTACGRIVRASLRCATSDEDFGCDPDGRCRRCWGSWKEL